MVSRADARDSLLPRSWPGGLDDVVEAVLTEENLVADEEGRGAEGAASDRAFGVINLLVLDGGFLAFLGDFGPGEARGIQSSVVHTSEFPSPIRISYSFFCSIK